MRSLLLLVLITACCTAVEPTTARRPLVDIVTNKGTIRVTLFADEAPLTVATFLGLAQGTRAFTDPATNTQVTRPFYDGLTFHRVIQGFMIQGGDPLGNGTGGPGFAFADEINAASLGLDTAIVALPDLQKVTLRRYYEMQGYRYTDTLPASHRPVKGSLAMANAGPGTNGSQFFINLGDTPHLTGKHTVFGEVVSGYEIVEAIGAVAVDPVSNKPVEAVTIVSIRAVPVP